MAWAWAAVSSSLKLPSPSASKDAASGGWGIWAMISLTSGEGRLSRRIASSSAWLVTCASIMSRWASIICIWSAPICSARVARAAACSSADSAGSPKSALVPSSPIIALYMSRAATTAACSPATRSPSLITPSWSVSQASSRPRSKAPAMAPSFIAAANPAISSGASSPSPFVSNRSCRYGCSIGLNIPATFSSMNRTTSSSETCPSPSASRARIISISICDAFMIHSADRSLPSSSTSISARICASISLYGRPGSRLAATQALASSSRCSSERNDTGSALLSSARSSANACWSMVGNSPDSGPDPDPGATASPAAGVAPDPTGCAVPTPCRPCTTNHATPPASTTAPNTTIAPRISDAPSLPPGEHTRADCRHGKPSPPCSQTTPHPFAKPPKQTPAPTTDAGETPQDSRLKTQDSRLRTVRIMHMGDRSDQAHG